MPDKFRFLAGVIAIALLTGLHLAAFSALLHPNVSREYKAYYVDKISRDWHVQRYHATPEQGIDLSRDGWPDFVDHSFGISVKESFGRWTDTRQGLRAGFQFNRSFTGTVCLLLDAVPSNAMRGKDVQLAFGDKQVMVPLGDVPEVRSHSLEFKLDSPTREIEFLFPKSLPPANPEDRRQVGIGLSRMRFLPQPCSEVQARPPGP